MSKYAYYDPASLQVLDWMDTELFCYPERTSLIELTEQQWLEHFNLGQYVWVNVKDRAFITNLPPGECYRLNGNTWVYDAASFAIVLDNAKSRVKQAIKVSATPLPPIISLSTATISTAMLTAVFSKCHSPEWVRQSRFRQG